MLELTPEQLLLAGFIINKYLTEIACQQNGNTQQIITATKLKCKQHRDKILTHGIPNEVFDKLHQLVNRTNNHVAIKEIKQIIIL